MSYAQYAFQWDEPLTDQDALHFSMTDDPDTLQLLDELDIEWVKL